MSLIVTHISKYGIVHASDTAVSGAPGPKPKLFRAEFLKAGVAVAGQYLVHGQEMCQWMPNWICIQREKNVRTIASLAQELALELTNVAKGGGINQGLLVHVGGFAEVGGIWHPELHLVTNLGGIAPNGDYAELRSHFGTSEEFWGLPERRQHWERGGSYAFMNGHAPGRVLFQRLQQPMFRFLQSVWRNPELGFSPPTRIEHDAEIARLYIQTIIALYKIRFDEEETVGGNAETMPIERPPDSMGD